MKIIFVLGTPRSGTTFLQACLLGLSGYTSVPETHYFNTLYSRRGVFSWRSKVKAAARLRKSFGIRVLPSLTIRGASSQFMKYATQHVERGEHIGLIEKTPIHLWYRQEISSAIPEAIFIHIVRNRYNAVRSLHAATNQYPRAWGGARTILECDLRWQQDIKLHHRFLLTDSLFVSYEQLCASPEQTLHRLARRLGENLSTCAHINQRSVILSDEPWKLADLRAQSEGKPKRYDDFPTESSFNEDHPLDETLAKMYQEILNHCI